MHVRLAPSGSKIGGIIMANKTCGTCIDNDCGLCERSGIWVEDDDDDDACEKHRENESA